MSIISSITNDIFIRTLTNITTSLITTHSLFVWFVDYNNNDYNIYKKEIKLTDIHNKLLIKIKENFTGFEQQLFVSSFYCYIANRSK